MASLDFSRSVEQDITTMEDRRLYAKLDYTRDDEVGVDFSGIAIKMEIYDRDGGTLLDTLTSASEIAISTARLRPVCPPRVDNSPSGSSFSLIRARTSTVSGSI